MADLEDIYYKIYTLLEAGLPITRSFELMTQYAGGKYKSAFKKICEGLYHGQNLSEQLGRYPKIFPQLDVMVIQNAEISGNLPAAFKYLCEWQAFKKSLKRTLIKGVIYPVFVFHAAAFFLPIQVLLRENFNLISYLRSVLSILTPMYVLFFAIRLTAGLMKDNGILKKQIDAVLLRVLLLGSALKYLALTRFCRAFYILYSSGIPIIQSAENAVKVCGNAVIKEHLNGAFVSASKGQSLYEGFSDKLPAEFTAAWTIGEQSGSLDKTAKKLADIYQDKSQFMLKEIFTWIPRILYFAILVIMAIMIVKAAMSFESFYNSQM